MSFVLYNFLLFSSKGLPAFIILVLKCKLADSFLMPFNIHSIFYKYDIFWRTLELWFCHVSCYSKDRSVALQRSPALPADLLSPAAFHHRYIKKQCKKWSSYGLTVPRHTFQRTQLPAITREIKPIALPCPFGLIVTNDLMLCAFV